MASTSIEQALRVYRSQATASTDSHRGARPAWDTKAKKKSKDGPDGQDPEASFAEILRSWSERG